MGWLIVCGLAMQAQVSLTLTTPLSGKIFHRQGGTYYGKSMYQI